MVEYIDKQIILDKCQRLIDVERKQGSDVMNYDRERVNQTEVIMEYIEYMTPSEDVIERSEYEKVLEENKQLKHIISDKVDKDLKCAFEVKELRSKIDKALEQTYKVRDMVLHSNRMYEPNDVLEIIDEITACFERSIGE